MIKLCVKDYCHDCKRFEPKVTDNREFILDENDFVGVHEVAVHDLIITCKFDTNCAVMAKYLKYEIERKMKQEGQNK